MAMRVKIQAAREAALNWKETLPPNEGLDAHSWSAKRQNVNFKVPTKRSSH
jgi:hypothetical protein